MRVLSWEGLVVEGSGDVCGGAGANGSAFGGSVVFGHMFWNIGFFEMLWTDAASSGYWIRKSVCL